MLVGLGQISSIVLPTTIMGVTMAKVGISRDGCLVVEVFSSIVIEIMVLGYKLGVVLMLIYYTKQCRR
jgi:hypothetical protein